MRKIMNDKGYNKILTKDFLIREYTENRKSTRQIAKEVKCNQATVLKHLKKCNVSIRKKCYKGEKNHFFKDGRCSKTYYCIEEECNREISYTNWLCGKRRCASCSKKGERNPFFDSHKFLGKNNPSYIDGRSYEPYPIEFNNHLKEQIRKRDNYTCQKCFITEEEHLIICGFRLPVHHVDYDKQNCKEDNLITLCLWCNTRVNFNRDYWQNYFENKLKGAMCNGKTVSFN